MTIEEESREKDIWERAKDISIIFAAIFIPIILASISLVGNLRAKKYDFNSQVLELAINILNSNPPVPYIEGQKASEQKQTETLEEQKIKADKELREWAVDVINEYSEVNLSEDARKALVGGLLQLPSSYSPKLNPEFNRLEELLSNKKYLEADEETRRILYQISGTRNGTYLDVGSIDKIPCGDIATIDQLWKQYSNEKFGFSVQRKIWINNGSNVKFAASVGWKEGENGDWLTVGEFYKKIEAELKKEKLIEGSLPTRSPGTSEKSLSAGWLVWAFLPNVAGGSSCLEPGS